MSVIRRVGQRAWSELLVRRWNRADAVSIHPSARLVGTPIIAMDKRGRITVGAGTRLVSDSRRTPLGVNHPVVLRIMYPGGRIALGARVGMSGGTICAATLVDIGEGTLLGANVTIVDTDFHPIDHPDRWSEPLPAPREKDAVRIGRNCFIGTGAIVLKGTQLGDHCVVGAGSVVSGSFPTGSVVAGNPARLIREVRLPSSAS